MQNNTQDKWRKTVKIKHLLTRDEDYKSIKRSMEGIADVLDNSNLVPPFDTSLFRKIPRGNQFFKPVDYANKLLTDWYNYADAYRVWTE